MTYLYLAVKAWREILIGLLAFLLLVCMALLNNKVGQIKKLEQQHKTYVQEQEAIVLKAKVDVLLKEKQWSQQRLKAEQNYNAKIKQIKSDADLANASADGLSKQLKIASSRLSSATKETIVEYVDTSSDLFEKCVIKYRAVAEKADGHAVDAEKLMNAWPSD